MKESSLVYNRVLGYYVFYDGPDSSRAESNVLQELNDLFLYAKKKRKMEIFLKNFSAEQRADLEKILKDTKIRIK